MSIVVSGPFVVQTTSSTQQPQVSTFGELKECAAKIIANNPQADDLALAGAGILDGINDINIRELFQFGRKSQTDTTLVEGQSAYSLPSDFFAVSAVQLVSPSNNDEPGRSLEYIDWHKFQKGNWSQDSNGFPWMWTVKNGFDDGELLIWPKPDATAVSDWKLRITYYERIGQPTADGDIIDAPKELATVLCWYGKWWMVMHRKANDKGLMDRCYGQYRDKLDRFTGSIRRQPDSSYQIDIPVDSDRSTGWRRGRLITFRNG